ncbi:MAG: AAA family ATPase [Bacteroidota bacterium]
MDWSFPYFTAFQNGPSSPSWGDRFQEMENQFSWIPPLAETHQDPIFHAEGDVWTHTKMVVEALYDASAWANQSRLDQQMLFTAALMHDVAKAWTTETIEGRIRAPRHAKKGAQFARHQLFRLDQPPSFTTRETIHGLIRYHGLPLWFWDKEDPRQFVFKAALKVPFRLLIPLVRADIAGRICHDEDELNGRLAYFEEYVIEQQCLQGPYPFPSDLARFTYFRKLDSEPTYDPYDDYQSEVILLAGLPGSGKNTWIEQNAPDWPIVSLDAIRRSQNISPKGNQGYVAQQAKEQAKSYLRKSQSFIWNATNLTRTIRDGLINLFETYKAKTRVVYLETNYHELLRRNRSRTHPIPRSILEKMIDKLQVPEPSEAPNVDYLIDLQPRQLLHL